jgi:hypothetical protein
MESPITSGPRARHVWHLMKAPCHAAVRQHIARGSEIDVGQRGSACLTVTLASEPVDEALIRTRSAMSAPWHHPDSRCERHHMYTLLDRLQYNGIAAG